MLGLLIDGLNLIRRVYAAVPGVAATPEHDAGVLESCARSVERALDGIRPTHAVCVLDGDGKTWRHELLASYKADRPPMPEALTALLPRLREAFDALAVRSVDVAGFEADDVLASIATRIVAHGGRVVILSTDKSMLSLLCDGVRVRDHFADRDLDADYTRERFGVAPDRLPTWLALVGERSHGIPGVRSVGAKTAAKLIGEHGTLDAILAAAEQMPGRLGEALRRDADDARLSLRLATLRTDVSVGLNLNACRVSGARGAGERRAGPPPGSSGWG